MFEQYGPLYRQNPAEINNPSNDTYKRLYQSTVDNEFYLRHSDGTDELFSSAIGVAGGMHFQGGWDASLNTFPAIGGSGPAGVIAQGDVFVITVSGTLCGILMNAGDLIIARVNLPAQLCGNWALVEMAGAFVPYVGANATVDLNTQTLIAGLLRLGITGGSSILELQNADTGKQLVIKSSVVGFNEFVLQLGLVGSLTEFKFNGPAFLVNRNMRIDDDGAGANAIYVNNVGLGLSLNGANSIGLNAGILVKDNGVVELANDAKGFATLVGGSIVVATTKVTATSKIILTVNNDLGVGIAVGIPYIETRIANTSFTINSNDLLGNLVATDVREITWAIFE